MSDQETTDPLAEVKAMQKLAEAVADLDPEATGRVLRWAAERYGVAVPRTKAGTGAILGQSAAAPQLVNNGNGGGTLQFSEFAELFAAASPDSEADKALVAGYWFQFLEEKPEFGGQEVNAALKNLGHYIKNITSAFDTLKGRKPAPVVQLKKSGSTRQARKTYKLTTTGKTAVEMMVGQHQQS